MGLTLHALEFFWVYSFLALVGAHVKSVAVNVNEVVPVSVLSSFKVQHPRRSAHLATRIPEGFVLGINIFPSSFIFILVHGIAGMRAIAARRHAVASATVVSSVAVKGVPIPLCRFCEPFHRVAFSRAQRTQVGLHL